MTEIIPVSISIKVYYRSQNIGSVIDLVLKVNSQFHRVEEQAVSSRPTAAAARVRTRGK
jgi:hypothetical protein